MSEQIDYIYLKSDTPTILIPSYIRDKAIDNRQSIVVEHDNNYMLMDDNYLFLKRQGVQTNIPFDGYIPVNDWLDRYKDYHTPYHLYDKYQFVTNIMKQEVFKSPIHNLMFKPMHPTFFNIIQHLIVTSNFAQLYEDVTNIASKTKIIPDNTKFFDLFRNYNDIRNIKVVIVTDEAKNEKSTKSAFLKNYPIQEWAETKERKIDKSFLFLNASLTSRPNVDNAHFDLWKPFMTRVINALSSYFTQPVLFVMVGDRAIELQGNIRPENMSSIRTSSSMYSEKTWISLFNYIDRRFNKINLIEW